VKRFILPFVSGILLLNFGLSAEEAALGPSSVCEASPAAVLSLDELAADWIDAGTSGNPPAVFNFWGGVKTEANLTAFECLVFPPYSQGGGSAVLSMDGKPIAAEQSRWFPYQVLRRATRDGIVMESAIRMPFEQQGLFCRLIATNTNATPRTLNLAMLFHGRVRSYEPAAWDTWSTPKPVDGNFAAVATDRQVVTIHDKASQAAIAYALVRVPDQLRVEGEHATADWHIRLPPRASVTLDYAAAVAADGPTAAASAMRWAEAFDQNFQQAKTRWAERWRAAFVLGNKQFSGHLPTLVTEDEKIRRVYYESALVPLLLLRTNLPASPHCFVTAGPQSANTLMYFWDTGMWANTWAMLEPAGMKQLLGKWLTLDLHGDVYALDCLSGLGGEKWYAANDWSVFRCLEAYLDATGDRAFLREKIKGKTVLKHMEQLATAYREFTSAKLHRCRWCAGELQGEIKLHLPYTPSVLADYGKNTHLLECAPAYEHRVPSFNAANVYMLRRTADYLQSAGHTGRAAELRDEAGKMSAAVLDLYVPGEGVWTALSLDGKRNQLRHCFDYILVGQALAGDLSARMKSEMTAFVERELRTKTWMRAMSLQDPAAANSDRPDHGPLGSYDGWPPLTMDVMCRFGMFRSAVEFLRSTEAVTHEGPFAQSHEFLGPNQRGHDPMVRIASRGGQEFNSCCGTAFAGTIIGSFFGYRPDLPGSDLPLLASGTPRGFRGELLHLPHHGALYTITSDTDGVHARREGSPP
jgi:hypothetical protein